METNPYQSPNEAGYSPPTRSQKPKKIDPSVIGFLLAIAALLGAANIAWTGEFVDSWGYLLAPSALAGVVLSLIGFLIRPSRIAALGIAIGLFVVVYLAAFWLALV